ncbi:hypothetical protein COCNU_06G018550 [Cocos nucifera]|uniref:Uncharacterized protein n=1 Tax=Cocos nucifera TaxID=13894 RepID=A0A8K0ID18_COCNU|nr:hypothetical protein COCNU_06G018550 [Cocos nucifera]
MDNDSNQKEYSEWNCEESKGQDAVDSVDKKNSASKIEGGVHISAFDHSVENFFATMDAILALCGERGEQHFESGEIQRFSSMITFLKEWRHFCYEPKIINFSFETESGRVKEAPDGIHLSQFSSAAVPKMGQLPGKTRNSDSNDFVLHAGGHVWGLDWCPRIHEKPHSNIKFEYLAVAAHPPGSTYHKIGVPLIGRGAIQIWCLLTLDEKVEFSLPRSRRGRPKKEPVKEEALNDFNGTDVAITTKRPRGRPRKRPVENDTKYALNVEDGSDLPSPRWRPKKKLTPDVVDLNGSKKLSPAKPRGRPRKKPASDNNSVQNSFLAKPRGRPRKHPPPSIENSNDKDVSRPCGNNHIQIVSESNLPITVSSGNNVLALSFSADVNCEEVTIQKGCRGRPRKNSISTVDDHVPESGVESGNGTSSLATSSRSETLNMNESFLCSNNQIPSAVDLVNIAVASPVSADANCEEGTIQKRCRGRPRKNSISNVNEHIPASGVESLHGTSSLVTSTRPETLNMNESRSCSNNQIPSAVDLGNTALALPVSAHVNCERGMIQKKHRGRPRKNSISNANEHIPVSGVESGNGTSSLATSTRPETLNINESFLCSHNQIPSALDSGTAALPLPVSAGVNCEEGSIKRRCEENISSINECVPASGVVSGNGTSSLATASRSETLNINESCRCCNSQIRSTGDCILHLTVELGNAALALPVSADANCNEETFPPRRRGRPRKRPLPTINKCVTASGVESGNDISVLPTFSRPGNLGLASSDSVDVNCKVDTIRQRHKGRHSKQLVLSLNKSSLESGVESVDDTLALPTSRGPETLDVVESPLYGNSQDAMLLSNEVACESSSKADLTSLIPTDIALPRVVLCLAHNGKVAWDVKWRPYTINDSEGMHHMGYLAVLLGNGSLEVWEVPTPSMVKVLFASSCGEGTDPRFLKLEPVFRCSKVKCGDRHSIPLTMEWSPSTPHDLILAGCHDGTVALWKFATQYPSQDTKPLLCFTADSAPIRALAWAPEESDKESANLFVTAGHEGLKFWDLRDPYRPLWDLNPTQRAILSVDWVIHPRCIILSLDDGTLRILSLWKAAYDVPVTGRPFAGTKYQGLHNFGCSSFAVWSAQVSQTLGLVAYCSADGSTVRFQLTAAVDKDPKRNPKPHFLCGSLMEKGQVLEINSPLPDVPLPNIPFAQKKSVDDCVPTMQLHGCLSDVDQAKQTGHAVAGNEETMGNTTSKSRKNERKKQQASAIAGQTKFHAEIEQGILQRNENRDEGSPQQFEAHPPKVVAMHRVRWNMNRGSERWLCYGGAAGIIRCQQVSLPTM